MTKPAAQLTPTQTADRSLQPLSIIRTETVLSRLPIHNLAKRGRVDISITKKNKEGVLDLRWEVSYNERYGQPRQIAYRLDTIVINQKIDAAGRPLPKMIYLGSLRDIATELGLGADTNTIKKALRQNAFTSITAKVSYRGTDGTEKRLEADFTRYSVVFTGEKLPTGEKADAVYLLLNQPYWEVLNYAPTRPLDYAYLKALAPTAQRFYEIVSYKMFTAIKYKHAFAKLPYSEYCTFSAQQRYYDYDHVKKQMYKVHRPHLQSGYITKIRFDATTDSDGNTDWIMHYAPGPKARAEHQTFNGKHAAHRDDALTQPTVKPLTPAARGDAGAEELVRYFHQRFHRTDTVMPTPKELEQAADLITAYGSDRARFIVEFSSDAARSTNYAPRVLGGIVKYRDEAIRAYDIRQKKREQEEQQAREEKLRAAHERYRDQEIERMKSTMSPEDLATLETSVRAKLIEEKTKDFMLNRLVQVRRDTILAERAGVLSYKEWRATHS